MFRFGSAPSIPVNLTLIFHIRGLLPFSGVFSVISLLSSSKSVHFSLVASPERIAVSFSSRRKAASFLWAPEIRLSSSSSFGMNGILRVNLVLGFSHFIPYLLA